MNSGHTTPFVLEPPAAVPTNPELLELARRLFWWKPPEEALAWPTRFLAQVMTLGTWDDIQLARHYWTDNDFRAVLQTPPSGVFDRRSWSYWHCVLDLQPIPSLPQRRLP